MSAAPAFAASAESCCIILSIRLATGLALYKLACLWHTTEHPPKRHQTVHFQYSFSTCHNMAFCKAIFDPENTPILMWSLAGMHLAVTSFDEYFLQEFAGLIAEKSGEPDEVCHGELGVAKMPTLALDADFHTVKSVLVET